MEFGNYTIDNLDNRIEDSESFMLERSQIFINDYYYFYSIISDIDYDVKDIMNVIHMKEEFHVLYDNSNEITRENSFQDEIKLYQNYISLICNLY